MGVVLPLLRVQLLQIVRAGVRSGRPSLGWRGMSRPLYFLAIAVFIGWQVYHLAVVWVSNQTVARTAVFLLFQPALTSLGSAAVIIIFFYAFTSLIGTLTDRSDLRLLLLAPVRAELILGEKLLLTSLGFSGVLLIALPACYAVGTAVNAAPLYYVAVLAAILVLPIAPVSLGALVLVALLRWLPPARARTISTVVGTLLGLAFFFTVQLVNRGPGSRTLPSLPAWLPSTWPGRFVAEVGLGNGSAALRDGGLSLALALALFVVATAAAARVLATGSAGYAEVGRRRRSEAPTTPRTALPTGSAESARPRRARPVWWLVLRKDMLSLRRDPQRLVAFVYPLFIVGFNAYAILSRDSTGPNGTAVGATLSLLILAALLLVNTTTPGLINREGRAILLLGLAPVAPSEVLKGKWIGAAAPSLLILEMGTIGLGVYLRLAGGQLALIALALAALVVALSGATLAINAAWPKLDATNPRRQASGIATTVSLIADALISIFAGIMLVLVLFVWDGTGAWLGAAALFIGLGAVSAAAAWLTPGLLEGLFHREGSI